MTTPDVPHRFELVITVPGTPDDVWDAIATAGGISSWMLPTVLEPRLGGDIEFHMGPESVSRGRVTAYEPGRRFAFEEDWAALVGQPSDSVTPLATEFLVEAASGGSCVVRVVTSAFGTGADWENEFWGELNTGWAPMLDNLRLYLTHFPGQRATLLGGGTTPFAAAPEAGIAAARAALGVTEVGDAVSARGVEGVLLRSNPRDLLVRVERPVRGFLALNSFGDGTASVVHLQGYLFSDDAAAYVEREQPAWQEWLDGIGATAAADASATVGTA